MNKLKYIILIGFLFPIYAFSKVIVAVDAGHGGHDPGAIGPTKLYEKTVTLGIAKKLQNIAAKDKDKLIEVVLTRNRDNFLSVFQRSEVARKYKANYLVSIHADATDSRGANGASVWVLSMKRADTELGRWLEDHEKQSELLGGAGTALSSNDDNIYLSQAVLDLQFSHSQKMGYELGTQILNSLTGKVKLHKRKPEHASLGVLRSPDIPSVLVEVGFISNRSEESLLRTDAYQQKIAQAIYDGIKRHVKRYPPSKR